MQKTILSDLELADRQREAAFADSSDIVVLAGAGCGKTTTLVARYLYLLQQGLAPEEIVAITFTERAGQEMRVRIRRHLRAYLSQDPPDQALWLERYIALDGAPIGTIHGLCRQLLAAHSAEAGLDPNFVVLDDSQAASLQVEAVERALVWGEDRADTVACFTPLGGPDGLRRVLEALLSRRLDVEPALEGTASSAEVRERWRRARLDWLRAALAGPEWEALLAELSACEPLRPGDALDQCRLRSLAAVQAARAAAAVDDWEGALATLREGVGKPGNLGSKSNWSDVRAVRTALSALCDLCRQRILNLTGKADLALDDALAEVWPGLVSLFRQACRDYEALKAQEQAVDFDDLEAGALRLLQTQPEVAAYCRSRFKAALVDEFQDTNERQRRLIEALLGAPAGQTQCLFVVGDGKQSIYRFRGADVTVFREVERQIRAAGGRPVSLDLTYRTHAPLLAVLNRLLAAVLGTKDDPERPFLVPFAGLSTHRSEPRLPVERPFVELHLALGPNAEAGRQEAARALAARLRALHNEGAGVPWGEMACLFRASTNYGVYEEAFDAAGIPYVTVAGAGFYERPEVRDLLNALAALANPSDDLALAGLLRSPAIGLSDASLYILRRGQLSHSGGAGRERPLQQALHQPEVLALLEPGERARAGRAASLIAELHPQMGRLPVAAVLKAFLDRTGYRAILRLCPQTERAGRNVDKLLADAHRSGAVGVGELLQYVQSLKDTGAREGEAPPEADEAVQLMTVHKAKGLEFGVVVLADAGHGGGRGAGDVLLDPEWGLLIRVSCIEESEVRTGLMHGLAAARDSEMDDAEERRLLYVAATRAKDKLLISGHVQAGKGGLRFAGWLDRLAGALGGEEMAALEAPAPGSCTRATLWGGDVSCTLYAPAEGKSAVEAAAMRAACPEAPELAPPVLAHPLPLSVAAKESETPDRVWWVVPPVRGQLRPPAWVVGKLVHIGLRLWRFPGDPGLASFLEAAARQAGLTDEQRLRAALRRARDLLQRLAESPLYAELDAAERYHEVPYSFASGTALQGRIDLLCRRPASGDWWLLDFKTDELHGEPDPARMDVYRAQLLRYRQAVQTLLGVEPALKLCFLDYNGQVVVKQIG